MPWKFTGIMGIVFASMAVRRRFCSMILGRSAASLQLGGALANASLAAWVGMCRYGCLGASACCFFFCSATLALCSLARRMEEKIDILEKRLTHSSALLREDS
jgi:hypothetical protein